MSLFEWIGESVDPGSTGTVELGGEIRPSGAPGGQILLQLVFAGLLVGGALWVVFGALEVPRTSHNLMVTAAVGFSYLGLAWLIRPRPDMSNLGWAGGMIDHPFRYSDDLNRSLLFFSLLLMPGRFVAECLVDALAFVFGGQTGATRRRAPPAVGPRAVGPPGIGPRARTHGARGRW